MLKQQGHKNQEQKKPFFTSLFLPTEQATPLVVRLFSIVVCAVIFLVISKASKMTSLSC